MTKDWSRDLMFALQLADVADRLSRFAFKQPTATKMKSDGSPVTASDLEIESTLAAHIAAERPGDQILGEEIERTVSPERFDRPTWVIDPIDHTRHFARQNPNYATLIALVADGHPQVGVVSAPSIGRRWWAMRGGGAWENGRAIRVSTTSTISAAHIGVAGLREWVESYDWDRIKELLSLMEYPQGTAGGFLPAMMVANSQLDAFFEPWGAFWDHAATEVIIDEAGGRATTLLGKPIAGGSLLVSNRLLHSELLEYFMPR